jgi:hypothetical protein
MSSRQKVPQAHKLAVVLIFHVYDSPSVLASSDGASPNDDVLLGANDGERD